MRETAHVTRQLLARAQSGDGDAFAALTGPFRRELQVHCYRILGSAADAEDMLQETMMAAWRGLDRFEGRASLRTWLHAIATNKCLNHLRASRTLAPYPPEVPLPEPTRSGEPLWLEPYPDALLGDLPDDALGPEARYEVRESVSLAFVTALQHLPPRQRAALVLRDVLGFRAAETAAILGCTVDAANNLLKRARATIASHLPPGGRDRAPLPGSAREQQITARFAEAFEHGDVQAIVALLTDDAWLTMPPLPFEYQGLDTIANFLDVVVFRHGTRRSRLIPTRANGQPAFGRYLADPYTPVGHAHGLIVLTLAGDYINAITGFTDNSVLPRFGLPRTLPE
ncbi:MAG TPA: sigma-70 family RNA polymerase sigma factor [Streptosporangiaceae bacterium]|nr:sigma-70 family RNA polymerase sigma factor [Streptosporangiaceae bacterium]